MTTRVIDHNCVPLIITTCQFMLVIVVLRLSFFITTLKATGFLLKGVLADAACSC